MTFYPLSRHKTPFLFFFATYLAGKIRFSVVIFPLV